MKHLVRLFHAAYLLAWALSPCQLKAQDQDLNKTAGCQGSYYCGGPNTPLQGIAWGAFTQNYLLTPRNPDQGVCIYVVNNNPTNAHPFTLAVSQTGDPNIISFSGQPGRWTSLGLVSTGTGSPSVPAASTLSFFTRSNAAAKIAFQFGGAGTLAGSPDTADIFITQTSGSGCGSVNPQTGQSYSLSTPGSGGGSAPAVQIVSDGLSQAFNAGSGTITNPASGAVIIHVNVLGAGKTLYFDKLIVSASAATSISVNGVNTTGSGCSVIATSNQKLNSAVLPAATSSISCTTVPNNINGIVAGLPIGAGAVFTLDLRGFIAPAGTNTGIDVVMAVALTGTINATLFWYEK